MAECNLASGVCCCVAVVALLAGIGLFIGGGVAASRIATEGPDFMVDGEKEFAIDIGNSNCTYRMFAKETECSEEASVIVTPTKYDPIECKHGVNWASYSDDQITLGVDGNQDPCKVYKTEPCRAYEDAEKSEDHKDLKLREFGYIQLMKLNNTGSDPQGVMKHVTGEYVIKSADMSIWVVDSCAMWVTAARRGVGAALFFTIGAILVCGGLTCACVGGCCFLGYFASKSSS